MTEDFPATVGAGTLRADSPGGPGPSTPVVDLPHRWTPAGARLTTELTGAHLLHLAVAGCVLNDLFREAAALGVELAGAQVTARGGFDPATWASTGVDYAVRLDTAAGPADVERLLAAVDAVAEIPRALRQGVAVRRVIPPASPSGPRG
jgi:hypothetical protein